MQSPDVNGVVRAIENTIKTTGGKRPIQSADFGAKTRETDRTLIIIIFFFCETRLTRYFSVVTSTETQCGNYSQYQLKKKHIECLAHTGFNEVSTLVDYSSAF